MVDDKMDESCMFSRDERIADILLWCLVEGALPCSRILHVCGCCVGE